MALWKLSHLMRRHVNYHHKTCRLGSDDLLASFGWYEGRQEIETYSLAFWSITWRTMGILRRKEKLKNSSMIRFTDGSGTLHIEIEYIEFRKIKPLTITDFDLKVGYENPNHYRPQVIRLAKDTDTPIVYIHKRTSKIVNLNPSDLRQGVVE